MKTAKPVTKATQIINTLLGRNFTDVEWRLDEYRSVSKPKNSLASVTPMIEKLLRSLYIDANNFVLYKIENEVFIFIYDTKNKLISVLRKERTAQAARVYNDPHYFDGKSQANGSNIKQFVAMVQDVNAVKYSRMDSTILAFLVETGNRLVEEARVSNKPTPAPTATLDALEEPTPTPELAKPEPAPFKTFVVQTHEAEKVAKLLLAVGIVFTYIE